MGTRLPTNYYKKPFVYADTNCRVEVPTQRKMLYSRLKKNLLALDLEFYEAQRIAKENSPDFVEVYADSLQQALEIASSELRVPISDLDYEIQQKGSSGILGFARIPYIVKISKMNDNADARFSDLSDLNVSLTGHLSEMAESNEAQNRDGRFLVRVFRDGVFLTVFKPVGSGKAAELVSVIDRIKMFGVNEFSQKEVESAVKKQEEKPVKIGNWVPVQGADSTLTVEVSPDEMKAFVTVSAPRVGGRHLKIEDVKKALNVSNVLFGFKDEDIQKQLDSDAYNLPFLAAEGIYAKDGKDGYIDYKVRIEKKVEFKEDESGRVDFTERDLVENVVQGQILAILVPAEKGVQGRTITNRLLPANNGKPVELRPGSGTILSDKGDQLIAEKNGQVVFKAGKVNVEDIFTIGGDVGLDTGNINFLGSVIVRGSISDNMEVKAVGNIEIGGNVQKANLEGEGDIIVKQGILGRDGANITSTTGSIFAKFIQNAKISAEKDIIVSEAIMHSKIEAGNKIIVSSGKRAQIVGGEIMAGEEIRCKQLGAQANTATHVVVGTSPKLLQQLRQMEEIEANAKEKLEKMEQNLVTLNKQKVIQKEAFPPEKEEMLVKTLGTKEKLVERIAEAAQEKEALKEYMQNLASGGRLHIEKTLFPNVTIEINGVKFVTKDEYHSVTVVEEKGMIKFLPLEASKEKKSDWRKGGKK